MLTEKIRLQLKSFNNQLLIQSISKITQSVIDVDCKLVGPIALPMDKRVYCLLRSPHVDKDSREHFEIRIHKRIIDIYYTKSVNIIDLLGKLELPAGIVYKIKIN